MVRNNHYIKSMNTELKYTYTEFKRQKNEYLPFWTSVITVVTHMSLSYTL